MNISQALKRIEEASSAGILFPEGGNSAKIFKQLASLVHPDHVRDPSLQTRAATAFLKLNNFYHSMNGNGKGPVMQAAMSLVGKWPIHSPFQKGDIADLYLTAKSEIAANPYLSNQNVLKIVRGEADNDLMTTEARVLKHLYDPKRTYSKYLPRLIDSFQAGDRQVNVLDWAKHYFSLDNIHQHFSSGVPFRHVVWMMNRLFSILGYSHQNGVIHGAVLPEHLLYGGETPKVGELGHGLKLVDWTCAVDKEQPHIPMIVKEREGFYPPEVRKKVISPATDIYMAVKSLCSVSGDVPKRFRGFFEWCLLESRASRPSNAWELQDQWVNLAAEEYGKPSYSPLDIQGWVI